MRRSIAVLAVCMGLLIPAFPALADSGQGPVHLALGDSQAYGLGVTQPDELGYVAVLYRWLRSVDCRVGDQSACPHLELVNLAIPGATTSSLVADQLADAIELIGERNNDADPDNDVIYVTVTVGGNDLFDAFFAGGCLNGATPQCVNAIAGAFGEVQGNLVQILGSLRAAAGPDTRIVISTIENPLGACVLADFEGFGDVVLEGGPGLPVGFNQLVAGVAAATQTEVADMYGQLDVDDWVGGEDCRHPDISGYHRMADVFLSVLD